MACFLIFAGGYPRDFPHALDWGRYNAEWRLMMMIIAGLTWLEAIVWVHNLLCPIVQFYVTCHLLNKIVYFKAIMIKSVFSARIAPSNVIYKYGETTLTTLYMFRYNIPTIDTLIH